MNCVSHITRQCRISAELGHFLASFCPPPVRRVAVCSLVSASAHPPVTQVLTTFRDERSTWGRKDAVGSACTRSDRHTSSCPKEYDVSRPHSTPPSWYLPTPLRDQDGGRITIALKRSGIQALALATALVKAAGTGLALLYLEHHTAAISTTYSACVVVSLVLARLVRRATDADRYGRLWISAFGAAGLTGIGEFAFRYARRTGDSAPAVPIHDSQPTSGTAFPGGDS